MKNSLNIEVTRLHQILIIMRGIPGAGKSTEAARLKGDGAIFSTDTRIEEKHDYRKFFEDMILSKDFSPLSKMHAYNFKLARLAMEEGITPVIVDNTNIKANEPKNYVEAALRMGFDDKNIHFVDVGDGGCTAEELAERNSHGVPLDKIASMMQSHKSVGPLTLKKVLKAKPMFSRKFASVVLDDKSRSKLLGAVGHKIPAGWDVIAHHMTINFGKGLPKDLKEDKGLTKELKVTELGISDKAVAVRVEGYHTDNAIPHITLGVNPDGGKPVMSNDITKWTKLDNYINLSGVVSEEKLG